MSPANFCKRVKCRQPGTHKQQLHTPLLDPDLRLPSLTHSSMARKKAAGAPPQEEDKSDEASNKRPTRSAKVQEAATPSDGTSEHTAGDLA